ncbi:class I adenylate-forming enzyme family protein [Anaeromyxobacter oryzisoli]|uniref:class I adenylate-forming enzyme family protein n=1 Tax=Anaeromyxobacter oryzisoli TaxID=2925408 RepID=UPI001F594E9B|nr:AMP-binding protein [Anaeromyxobacter sp. SG63]
MMLPVTTHAPEHPVALGAAGARTAAELLTDASRVAAALARREPGEVLLVCEDRYLFAAGLLGAWTAGHAVLLPPNGQPEVLAELASGPLVRAFADDRGAGDLDLRQAVQGPPGPAVPAALDARRALAVLMTSGSAGPHQRCRKSAAQLLGEAETLALTFAVGSSARVLASVPPHHIYGLLFGVLLPLRAGAAFVRETPLHAEAVAEAALRAGATHFVSVPAHLQVLARAEALPAFVRVFSSGAPLPAETARALRGRLRWDTVEVFGSSETGGIAWRGGPDEPWRPFPGVTVSAGEDGALLLDSPLLQAKAPRPLTCADRVALRGDGAFELLGRRDGIVKVGGKRVSLREVEERLLSVPGVRDAAALARDGDGARGQEVWAAAVAPGWSAGRLRSVLTRWLDPVAVPRQLRLVAALPRDGSGKLPRARLLALFERRAEISGFEVDAEAAHTDDRGREVRRLELTVPLELVFFEGHFDAQPVLAGIVQLKLLVLRQARRLWPDLDALQRILRLKFSRIIGPGTRIVLTLTRAPAAPAVEFTIASPSGPCASGTLHFRAQRPTA